MNTRTKLLVVFLALSLVPMLFMRANGQRAMQSLGAELAGRTRDVLIGEAQYELKRLVEDHARVLKRERELVENALSTQIAEIGDVFSGKLCSSGEAAELAPGCDRPAPGQKLICRMNEKGECEPIACDPSAVSVGFPGRREAAGGREEGRFAFSALLPWYKKMALRHPDLILWQITVMADGRYSIYPAVHMPEGFDPRESPWYRPSAKSPEPVWTSAYTDPISGRLVMAVSAPFFGPDMNFSGMAAIVVPVESFLHENEHIRRMSKNVSSFLVQAVPSRPGAPGKVVITARESPTAKGHMHMHRMGARADLPVADGNGPSLMADDIFANRPGVRRMRYNGRESLLAYGPVDDQGTALLLVVPEQDVTAEATAMESYVLSRISRQIWVSGLLLSLVALSLTVAALVLSGSLSRNIRKVAKAAARIAAGDFSTRVDIRSKDETGELASAFNAMIPRLLERLRIREALDVADQVQQNLLPRSAPGLPGFEVAGRTVYCEKTGGDYYDFIPMERDGKKLLGVAVGDVSDHGISSALLMTSARGFLRARSSLPGGPESIVSAVNRLLCEDVKNTGRFMTLLFCVIPESGDEMSFVRAGHEPGLILNPAAGEFRELMGSGVALGVFPDCVCPESRAPIGPGEILALATDGIRETRNRAGETFGKGRLMELLAQNAGLPAEAIVAAVLSAVADFRGEAPQEDDLTLVVVKSTRKA
ncbi:MAG: SpoIIE family protein phosphatase [Thermodesulfobacteriota bacterium]